MFLGLGNIVFLETFLYDIHFFDLDGWFVLDIEAYVDYTALYYASRGATVVAVEPLPGNYEVLFKNIALNPRVDGESYTR
jgi:tRNA G37 N-methylase Trm5